MKKLFALTAVLFILNGSFASVAIINPPLKASEIFFSVGKTGKQISLLDLSQIKIKDFEALTGEKIKLFSRFGFKIAQRQLRNSINIDGTFKNKKAEKYFTNPVDGQKGFHLGGFALGFFGWFSLVGILIAYLIHDDKRKNRIKWAWIGLGAAFVVMIILFFTGVIGM